MYHFRSMLLKHCYLNLHFEIIISTVYLFQKMSFSRSQGLFSLIKKTQLSIPNYKLLNGDIFTTSVRHAGHSKWSNIRHVKGANDLRVSKDINVHKNKIMYAIQLGNGEKNPERNNGLKKAISVALASNIPRAMIDRTLKGPPEKPQNEISVELQGPGGCGIIVECLAPNRKDCNIFIGPVLKKKGGLASNGILGMFDKKGIIIAHAKEGCSLDDAEEDAIEAGAEEVNEVEGDEKMLEFVTDSNDFSNVKMELEKKKYSFEDCSVLYVPRIYHELSPLDLARSRILIKSLEELDKVVGVHSNIA